MVVEVAVEGSERPPEGSPLIVRLLDTTYADAPATVVAEAQSHVEAGEGELVCSVELPAVAEGTAGYTVSAHVDVDGDGAVSSGDYVSTASYPVLGDEPVRIAVKRI